MLLRTMAPDILAVDEIGEAEEYECIQKINKCGCILIATKHGECKDVKK